MKKVVICLVLFSLVFLNIVIPQDNTEKEKNIFLTLNGLISIPIQEYKNDLSKDVFFGFSTDVTTVPFNNIQFWEMGGQFEFIHAGKKKDEWKGLELKSKSQFYRLNFINRIRPVRRGPVDPFIELAYGVNMSYTNSSYEIVDEVTFLEQFLFNAEDVSETKVEKEKYGFSQNINVGIGAIFGNIFVVQVKYNYCPNIQHVKKEDIYIEDDEIMYETCNLNMQLLTVSLGLFF